MLNTKHLVRLTSQVGGAASLTIVLDYQAYTLVNMNVTYYT